MLASEFIFNEIKNASHYWKGLSLFNRVGGMKKIIYGNCQFVPSSIWHDFLDCVPLTNNPLVWVDKNNSLVLKFERIAAPFLEMTGEAYIRQPILFRWVCDKSWLDITLANNNIHLAKIFQQTDYPKFYE